MTKRNKAIATAVIAAATVIAYCNANTTVGNYLTQSDVEATAACESVGWWDNDGNCVQNSTTKEYFCKDDTWHELTDCLK